MYMYIIYLAITSRFPVLSWNTWTRVVVCTASAIIIYSDHLNTIECKVYAWYLACTSEYQHTLRGKVLVSTTSSSSLLEELEKDKSGRQSGSLDGAGWAGGGLRGRVWATVRGDGGVGWGSSLRSLIGGGGVSGCEGLQSGSLDGAGWAGGGLRGRVWATVRGDGGVGWDSSLRSLVGGGGVSGCEGATGE